MNTHTIDKTTDKIITQMTPEAKGRYVANLMHTLGKNIASGKTSSEDAHTAYESFYSKYMRTSNPTDYISFLESRENATCKFLSVELLQKHNEVLDLKIAYLQTLIDIQAVWGDPTTSESSELHKLTSDAEKTLQTLIQERDELHSHPAYKLTKADDTNKNETVNGA